MIKVFTIAILTILFSSFCSISAQFNKGRFIIGEFTELRFEGSELNPMNISFSTMKSKSDSHESDSDKYFSFNLMPKVGYIIANNMAVGLDFSGASSRRVSSSGNVKDKRSIFSVGPFIRYYIPVTKVFPFLEINGLIGSHYGKTLYDDEVLSDYHFRILSWSGGVGMAIPIGEKVTFDAFAGYESYRTEKQEDNEEGTKLIIGTMGLKLGFSVLLGTNSD